MGRRRGALKPDVRRKATQLNTVLDKLHLATQECGSRSETSWNLLGRDDRPELLWRVFEQFVVVFVDLRFRISICTQPDRSVIQRTPVGPGGFGKVSERG